MSDVCSNCERAVEERWFCRVCNYELLCGSVAEDCPVEGCAERRVQLKYMGPLWPHECTPAEAFVDPKKGS